MGIGGLVHPCTLAPCASRTTPFNPSDGEHDIFDFLKRNDTRSRAGFREAPNTHKKTNQMDSGFRRNDGMGAFAGTAGRLPPE
jgi:hypothetical protein